MSTTNKNLFARPDSGSNSPSDSADMVPITARGISDPVFMHLSRTLPISELVQLKNVSKSFSELVSENSAITAHVRRQDNNSMDWYYPCYIQTRDYSYKIPRHYHHEVVPGLWLGVHRLSQGVFHTLPLYSHFLPRGASYSPQDVHASVEGLLLVLLENPDPSKWKPLVVTNPVTREWRLLPAPDCAMVGLNSWDYDNFQLHMIADKTTYKVIIVHKESLCVYNSTTKTWRSHILSAELPFGIRSRTMIKYYGPSSAVVNGRIRFAQLEYDGDAEPKYEVQTNLNLLTRGQVRVYEVDDEGGTWKPCVRYKLQDYFPSDLYRRYKDYGFRIGSYQVGIVECMGCMHAIIPAWLDNSKSIDEGFRQFHELLRTTSWRYTEYNIQKLRFYILRLEGSVGRPFGSLLIKDGRFNPNMENYLQNPPPLNGRSGSSYRCFGRGSVIWVTLHDYMLQYDVLSGRSKTEILPRTTFNQILTEQNVAFTPSLYATP